MKLTKTKFFHTLIIALVLVSLPGSVTIAPVYAATQTVTNASNSGAGSLRQTGIDAADTQPVLYAVPGGLISGECSTWATACELRYVLPLAIAGQEIWVKTGTYKPTNSTTRGIAFQLKAGVAVYGGFAGTENTRTQRDPAAKVTTLSGDLNGDDGANFANNGENSYHVVLGATNAILDGVTVSGGNANGSNPYDRGGGILNNSANPTLANLIISNNAANVGAGIYNDASSPALSNVSFNGNVASYSGGGMQNYSGSNPTLSNVTFSSNSAQFGGGMFNNASSPTLTDVTFLSNRATSQYGGGMQNESNSQPTLTNVTFKSNTAAIYGGGMFNTSSTPTLTNVTFSGNSTSAANSWGGGMFNNTSSPILTNVTFSGNITVFGGGAMANFSSSRPQVRNSIFWGNGGGYANLQVYNASATEASTINASIIPGCPPHSICTNLITTDPRIGSLGSYGGFTETYPLLPGSLAINASGNNCPATDQRGVARSAPICDIGAYESRGFTLAISGGSPQSTGINTAFGTPLSVLVSSAYGEPVAGGRVTFAPPASGASAVLSTNLATIDASGIASVTATANGTVGGPYGINTSAAGANTVIFTLTNLQTYTVTYNGNGNTGGSVPVDTASPYVEGRTVTVRGNTGSLVRSGHTFSGWNLQADGLGTNYLPASTFLMPPYNTILYAKWTDSDLPIVTEFDATSPVNDYSIPITSFSATDNVAVSGYMITESSAPPLAGDDGWTGTAPTVYTVTGNGVYTLYPWVKDAAGNVSPVYDSPATVTVQKTIYTFIYLPFIVR